MRIFDLWLLFIFILNISTSFFANDTVSTIAWFCAFMVQLRIVLNINYKE